MRLQAFPFLTLTFVWTWTFSSWPRIFTTQSARFANFKTTLTTLKSTLTVSATKRYWKIHSWEVNSYFTIHCFSKWLLFPLFSQSKTLSRVLISNEVSNNFKAAQPVTIIATPQLVDTKGISTLRDFLSVRILFCKNNLSGPNMHFRVFRDVIVQKEF